MNGNQKVNESIKETKNLSICSRVSIEPPIPPKSSTSLEFRFEELSWLSLSGSCNWCSYMSHHIWKKLPCFCIDSFGCNCIHKFLKDKAVHICSKKMAIKKNYSIHTMHLHFFFHRLSYNCRR